jgi:6-phosphofructokinase 2
MSPTIVTLTLNPAVDIACTTPRVEPEEKLRTTGEHYDPGGGGVNVARVIHDLGGEARALILVGGATGLLYEELLGGHGVPYDALPIRGRTRVALNVREESTGREYRFVPEGPVIAPDEWQAVLAALETVEAAWIVASGSLPRGVPEDFYARAAAIAARRGQRFVLDSSGAPLRAALGHGVVLAKPSRREFEALVGYALPDRAAVEAAALAMVRGGALEMLVVSLGGEGAFLATTGGGFFLPALQVPVLSAVGAGDSFVAAMVLSLARGEVPDIAFAWGMAAGAAAVASAGTAHPDPARVAEFFRRLRGGAAGQA